MSVKTIFFVATRFPYPLNSGQNVRVYNLLKQLSINYKIKLLITDSSPSQHELDFFKSSTNIRDVIFFPISNIRRIFNILISLFRFEPIQIGYYKSRELSKFLSHKDIDCDLFIFHLIRTAQYRSIQKLNVPSILEMCDALSSNYKQSFQMLGFFNIWKWISLYECLTLLPYEKKQIHKFNLVSLHTARDADKLNLSSNQLLLSKQGSNTSECNLSKNDHNFKNNKILFIGKLDFQPNISGLLWFIKCVLPSLPSPITIKIVGSNPAALLGCLDDFSRVELCNFLPNLSDGVRDCFCAIAPIFISTGTQTKVIDYFNLQLPVVMTKVVSEGFDTSILDFTFVADSDVEWSNSILNLYNSPMKFESFVINANHYAQENHNWNSIGRAYIKAIDDLICC